MTSANVAAALTALQTLLDGAPITTVTGTPRSITRVRRGARRVELAQVTPDGSVAAAIPVWVPTTVTWPPNAGTTSLVTIRGRWAVRRATSPAGIELTAISIAPHDTTTPSGHDTSAAIGRQTSRAQAPVKVIGLICARSGVAGRTDFVGRLCQLAPGLRYDTRPATLAGPGAVTDITNSIRALDLPRTDVIAIVRGGGASSDLATFDSRTLAQVISATATPIVVAVGHSTDRHLADDIAAHSAPTPTAAAELIGTWT